MSARKRERISCWAALNPNSGIWEQLGRMGEIGVKKRSGHLETVKQSRHISLLQVTGALTQLQKYPKKISPRWRGHRWEAKVSWWSDWQSQRVGAWRVGVKPDSQVTDFCTNKTISMFCVLIIWITMSKNDVQFRILWKNHYFPKIPKQNET